MDPNRRRTTNFLFCYALVGLGFLFILGTIFLGAFLKPGIIERARDPVPVSGFGDYSQVNYLDRTIKAKEQSIEFEKRIPDIDESLRKRADIEKALNKKIEVNSSESNTGESKADKIKRLEDERDKLIAERNELAGKIRAKQERRRSVFEWLDDYNFELLVPVVIPLGILCFYIARFLLAPALPWKKLLVLTNLERRCVLFLALTLAGSAFGFSLFVWILTIIY